MKNEKLVMNISERKLDYLFNQNIAADDHNTPRAVQNAQQMQRLGFWNNLEDMVAIFVAAIALSQNNQNAIASSSPFPSVVHGN